MTKLFNNHVIFSFDDPYDLHSSAKFYRFLDTLSIIRKLTYKPVLCTGFYEGYFEPSIMMDYNDYYKYIHNQWFMEKQESILVLNPRKPNSVSMQGTLVSLLDDQLLTLGKWEEISFSVAMRSEAWTCMDGKYFTC
jgi:hypothetical protein